MGVILAVCTIIMLSFSFTTLFHRRIEDTIGISICSIIGLLFVSSFITNSITLGHIYFVYACAVIFFILAVVSNHKTRQRFSLSGIITPGFFLFSAVIAVLAVFCANGRMVGYDDYNHWGLTVKSMYYLDRLSCVPESATFYKDYPPAMALLQYFFVRPGPYYDGPLILAYDIFMLAMFMPALVRVQKKIPSALIAFAIILLLPSVADMECYPWRSLYIDTALGAAMCNMLLIHFGSQRKEQNSFNMLSLCGTFFVLTLLKKSGISLALFAWFAIAFDYLWPLRRELDWKKLIYPLVPLLAGLLSYSMWKLCFARAGSDAFWDYSEITVKSVLKLFLGREVYWRYWIVDSFINRCFELTIANKVPIGIPFIAWPFLCCGIGAVSDQLRHDHESRFFTASVILSIGYLCYLLSLLVLFAYAFSFEEGIRLASYERYVGTYIIGFFGFSILTAIETIDALKEIHIKRILFSCVFCFMLMIGCCSDTAQLLLLPKYKATQTIDFIDENVSYSSLSQRSQYLNFETDRVYIVDYVDTLHGQACGHCLAPIRRNPWNTWDISDRDTWETELRDGGYTHVYICHANEFFHENCCDLFDAPDCIEDDAFYVVDSAGDRITLHRADF